MVSTDTKLEQETRETIDQKLEAAGWTVQDKEQLNLYASIGIAVREMDTNTGPADYMLFINGQACGIIEAKREGTDLGGVAEQSLKAAKPRALLQMATGIFFDAKPAWTKPQPSPSGKGSK